jgi:light-regulated signal transduction histidine kinase (bacteriophytochrome)
LTIAIILYFTNKKIHKINGILQQKNIEIEEKQRILEEQSKVLESKNNELEFYITSNAELEYFAQLASHDLKQPLRTVNSYVKLLQKAMKSENIVSTRVSEYLHFIAAGTKNMSIFIENLLAYSTISSKEKDIFEVVNLNDLMMLTIQNLRTQINESNVTIDFDNLPSELRVVKIKILQLLQNLISNAIKFSKPELPPVIDVRGIENEDFWELTVSDNGIGIPKNQQERIFKIFYRIHDQTKYEGNGIGLATCKKIIDQHNGKIWVTSEENVGTTFHFTILKH